MRPAKPDRIRLSAQQTSTFDHLLREALVDYDYADVIQGLRDRIRRDAELVQWLEQRNRDRRGHLDAINHLNR